MKMEKKRDFSVKELLSWGAVHSGYLSKVEKKSSFATTKKPVQRFCVIFNGELFIFAEKTSSIPLCNFILSNYCVELFAEPGRAQTLTQSYYINLQCENNTTQHQFVCSTYWEAEKWLNIIKNEMASYYPNGEKINGESYDYAQTKPTDISFSNPEKYDEKITNELFTGTSNTFDDHGVLPDSNKSFRGPTCRLTPAVFMPSSPKLSKSERSTPLSTSPIIESDHYKSPTVKEACACPIPPPRPEHTKKQMHSLAPHNEVEQSKKQTHSQGRRYEVSEIDAEAVGSPSRLPNGIKGPPTLPPRVLPQVPPDNRMSDATILPTTVYRWNMKRENAIELLKAKNVIGTYLIRKNSDERHVLTIYTAEKQSCRHFIIFQKNGHQFLASEPEPKFTKIGDLIRYYMKNNLPTCKIRLKQPYS